MPTKILIANRGEIAVRIIRACKELGIPCVAVYSKADANSLPVKLADESICIGDAPSHKSYLNMNHIISAAVATHCTAIHPGYGFLSENDKFAEIVEKCNLKFIGPSSKMIADLSNKVLARNFAKQLNIPVVPGSASAVGSLEEAKKIAEGLGYPLLIKASFGGGGKGIFLIKNENELIAHFDRTRLEAQANFNSNAVFLEKYIEKAHHVEVQIIADAHGNVVSLGERDCSVQRRNQKLVEETPAAFISQELRQRLTEDAIRLTKALHYESCGTVEFIVDDKQNHFFMEMNTRIQVEHPITEMVTGIDIVKEQIRIAQKQPLSIKQENINFSGCAIECRILAEDSQDDFRPSPGLIENAIFPGGLGVRVDTHIYSQYIVPPHYDSLLAKIIVWAPTRREAIRKMRVALEGCMIVGVSTNIELQYLLMHNPDFVRGVYATDFMTEFVRLVKEAQNE